MKFVTITKTYVYVLYHGGVYSSGKRSIHNRPHNIPTRGAGRAIAVRRGKWGVRARDRRRTRDVVCTIVVEERVDSI